jgi:glycosidase
MEKWPKRPIIYEINTWVWLDELQKKYRRKIDLAQVPEAEWDSLATYGFDAVWFMGVWQRSPAGIRISIDDPTLQAVHRQALADFRNEDVVGSPYCIRGYQVDEQLGGPPALATARQALAQRGMRLVLDFVPNHVAFDHPWVNEHPEYFVRGDVADLGRDPAGFYQAGKAVIARGRDPYFPPWPDVAQLNAFQPAERQVVIQTLDDIAQQCDGVRCDMAMLSINRIFQQTWGSRAGSPPGEEYWCDVIPAVRKRHANFLFIGEAYWDLEWELIQQGFDFCYDKRLYDRLVENHVEAFRLHLLADLAYQDHLIRFIENHDEPRAAAAFPPEKRRVAAVASLTVPGARLLHDGQFEARPVRTPVMLGRAPAAQPDLELQAFYRRLLQALQLSALRQGDWRLGEVTGWPDNATTQNLVTWNWEKSQERCLVVVNLSANPAQGRVRWPWLDANPAKWKLSDPIQSVEFSRDGGETGRDGLYIDLPGWGFHFFKVSPSK